MKIEIEISGNLFEKAKKTAKNLKISRKQLYRRAIKQFVEKHEYDMENITAKLNEFYSRTGNSFESYWK
jgi:predicted transcriptional regulator